MEQKITSFLIEDKKYFVLDEIEYQESKFLILVYEKDQEDILVQRYLKETPEHLYGVTEEQFINVLKIFAEKHKELA